MPPNAAKPCDTKDFKIYYFTFCLSLLFSPTVLRVKIRVNCYFDEQPKNFKFYKPLMKRIQQSNYAL